MRNEFCQTMIEIGQDPSVVFLTGDLGFMALEPLKEALGERFINAGVAEQNMVGVGAALAKDGWSSWCYSIAPFVFARPFEQIRNDICLHGLPVKLIGNGGGFGYGVMGPTHHAIEDYGVLLALQNMKIVIPAFDEDVPAAVRRVAACAQPSYLRLGRGELPIGCNAPTYEPWRRLLTSETVDTVVVSVGPIAGAAWSFLRNMNIESHELWLVSELPISFPDLPEQLITRVAGGCRLVVLEEHVTHGGVGDALLRAFAMNSIAVTRYHSLSISTENAKTSGYGDQAFMRSISNIGPAEFAQVFG
jgi:transketolase